MPEQDYRVTVERCSAAFQDGYLDYQYVFVEFFVEQMADVSRAFGGDMQLPVLLGIIGQIELQAAHLARRGGKSVDAFPPERRGVTLLRLSDASGIPRETVRRKLGLLEERGWVRKEDGFWIMATEGANVPARTALRDLDQRSMRRVAQLLTALHPLVAEKEDTRA